MKLSPFALLASVSLLLSSAGISQTPTAAPPARPVHLTFFYFRDVATQQFPNRPIQVSAMHDPSTGRMNYVFFDRRTRQRFRDGAQIRVNVAQTSATHNSVRLRQLRQEMVLWRALLSRSPIIATEADLETKSAAELNGNGSIAVSEVFTPQGNRKYSRFTKQHVGEINAIIVNDSVLCAPYVMELSNRQFLLEVEQADRPLSLWVERKYHQPSYRGTRCLSPAKPIIPSANAYTLFSRCPSRN